MNFTDIQSIMSWAGYEQLTTKPDFTGNSWSNGKQGGVITEEDLSEWNAVKKLESKMIEENVQGPIKNPEVKILTHVVSNNHVLKIYELYYELYHKGTKIFITSGSGLTEIEAVLNSILTYVNSKKEKL